MSDGSTPFMPDRSLEEVHRSVAVTSKRWWRRLFAFVGPAYMVSVGYMDPGNWATDLAGGSTFGYQLIWVLMMANLMAVLLQTLSARLGLVTGRDLAQACRDSYPPPVRWILFALCEVAIAATDLAEVIGSAIGLNLLFGIDVLWGVVITGSDVLLLLLIQRAGIRKMEAFIITLVATIGVCFVIEIFLCKPEWGGVAAGFAPGILSGDRLYIAIGILGATVMPHNLYLHSALVQSRNVPRSVRGVAQACKFNLIDSVVALNGAFFVNAAILIVAAATFYSSGIIVEEIQEAPKLLEGLLGSKVAPIAFALALLCAGQSSTVTGTLAGQITMEGFLQFRIRPWLRRLITRSAAIIPAVAVTVAWQDKGLYRLLILSQVILSLQLSFAVVPLVKFTGSRRKMGPFVNPRWVTVLAWLAAAVIMTLNGKLVFEEISGWAQLAGVWGWLVGGITVPIAAGLAVLLAWLILKRERPREGPPPIEAAEVIAASAALQKRFRRVGVALEAKGGDPAMLAEAVALARTHGAELVLMHVVEGVGGQWFGSAADDSESRRDEEYLRSLVEKLGPVLREQGVPQVRYVLGYGDVPRQLVRLARAEQVDLLVVGGHGHRGLGDLLHGTTINEVRHGLDVPIMAVRQ